MWLLVCMSAAGLSIAAASGDSHIACEDCMKMGGSFQLGKCYYKGEDCPIMDIGCCKVYTEQEVKDNGMPKTYVGVDYAIECCHTADVYDGSMMEPLPKPMPQPMPKPMPKPMPQPDDEDKANPLVISINDDHLNEEHCRAPDDREDRSCMTCCTADEKQGGCNVQAWSCRDTPDKEWCQGEPWYNEMSYKDGDCPTDCRTCSTCSARQETELLQLMKSSETQVCLSRCTEAVFDQVDVCFSPGECACVCYKYLTGIAACPHLSLEGILSDVLESGSTEEKVDGDSGVLSKVRTFIEPTMTKTTKVMDGAEGSAEGANEALVEDVVEDLVNEAKVEEKQTDKKTKKSGVDALAKLGAAADKVAESAPDSVNKLLDWKDEVTDESQGVSSKSAATMVVSVIILGVFHL